MLEKSSKYEIIPIDGGKNVLILYKSTETEDPFAVVAGYFLKETRDFDERLLAEIETIPVSEYDKLKGLLRNKLNMKDSRRVPITFW